MARATFANGRTDAGRLLLRCRWWAQDLLSQDAGAEANEALTTALRDLAQGLPVVAEKQTVGEYLATGSKVDHELAPRTVVPNRTHIVQSLMPAFGRFRFATHRSPSRRCMGPSSRGASRLEPCVRCTQSCAGRSARPLGSASFRATLRYW